ncbi:MAG: aminotransferase [Pseudomonadales bacterium]|jgi:putrescine aminotransferase
MSRRKTNEWQSLDRSAHLHPFTDLSEYANRGGRVISRAEGVYIYDSDGNELLDGMSGLWCTSLGYSQPRIVAAITDQLNRLPYYNSFFKCSTEPAIELAGLLREVTPDQFNHFFFTNSGSEANDTNIRLVHRYFDLTDRPQKKIIIARRNAYHGSTIGAASLGGMAAMHKQFLRLPYVEHVAQPYWYREGGDTDPGAFGRQVAGELAEKIDEIGAERVAAFIAEPIQGAGGVIIPPDSYWPEVAKICRERDVLLISDEVICGFGRTGSWFGCETFGFEPDLMTFAKAVTNGYQPLGGVAVGDRVADVLLAGGGEFTHGFTYSGHPVCAAAGVATIGIFRDDNVIGAAAGDLAPYLAERWASLADHPIVGETRTRGMLAAVELVRDKPTRTPLAPESAGSFFCRDAAIGNGLMVRAIGDAVVSAPPLVCTREEIDLLVERLRAALDATARHYRINTP